MTDTTTQRYVPGAPPPPPASKSGKKKRKTAKGGKPEDSPAFDSPALSSVAIPDASSAALVDKAPEPSDIKEGAVADALLVDTDARAGAPSSQPAPEEPKHSPIVDIIQKRFKATTKKISRIQAYATLEDEKLNEDQRRTLKGLPALEAVAKELEEVKKAVETVEAERAVADAREAAERERAEAEHLAVAIVEAESLTFTKISRLLHFLRLHSSLSARHPSTSSLDLQESEVPVIFAIVEELLGEESEIRQELIRGLLAGEGEFQGVSHSRFLDLAHAFANPPDEPASTEPEESAPADVEEEASASVAGLGANASTSGGFRFVQESELDNPALEDSQEWVDVNQTTEVEVTTTTIETPGGDEMVEQTITVIERTEAPLSASGNFDWAEDEGGLPPIAGLHAKFGTSETPSPATPAQNIPETTSAEATPASANGNLVAVVARAGSAGSVDSAEGVAAESAGASVAIVVDPVAVSEESVVAPVASEAHTAGAATASGEAMANGVAADAAGAEAVEARFSDNREEAPAAQS
ncbi:hypothetical protein BC834DRAFT_968084 [Gloeopeniophorella convolvens]|nr:hypothetical protein BC834DRAFT_968084 [Gloeopeniophorella convolvens]